MTRHRTGSYVPRTVAQSRVAYALWIMGLSWPAARRVADAESWVRGWLR